MQDRRSRSAFSFRAPAIVLGLTLLLLAVPSRAERVEDLPKPTDYVSDYAHVLSPATVEQLGRLCGQLDHSKTNAQIAIVTIHTLDGDDVSDFANRLEEKWKVGKKGSDRGILMLFAIQDRKRWIEVGYGLEGILPDAKVGDIGRAMVPALRQGNYDSAITTGLVQVANVIAADAKVTLQDQPASQSMQAPPQRHRGGSPIGFFIIVFLILLFLGGRGLLGFGLGWFLGGMGGGGFGGGGWGGGGGNSGGGSGGDGFSGFGGGESGGGGAGGDW